MGKNGRMVVLIGAVKAADGNHVRSKICGELRLRGVGKEAETIRSLVIVDGDAKCSLRERLRPAEIDERGKDLRDCEALLGQIVDDRLPLLGRRPKLLCELIRSQILVIV